jgi:type I restriction enzyme S subunit
MVSPVDWNATRIAALGRIITGGTPPSARPECFGSEFPFITPTDLQSGERDARYDRFLSPQGAQLLRSKALPPGSVCFTCIGATIGKACITTTESFTNQQINSIIVDTDRYDPFFVFYLLAANADAIKAQAGGAATPIMNKSAFGNILLPVPALPIQQRVGAILGGFDDLVENNTRRIRILEEMAQAIYREWFVEFRYPGHEGVPLVGSEVGPIPEGWKIRRLANLVKTQYGFTESATTEAIGPKFLRGMDINKTSFIDWSAVPYCPIDEADRVKYSVAADDIFIIRMADPGKIGIVEQEVDAVFASYLVRVRPVDGNSVLPYFLFYYLCGDTYQGFVTGASSGATRQSVSAKVMTAVDLAVPPAALQHEFERRVVPFRRLLANLLSLNASLRAARDLLLPRLISGEIDVSGLEVPEVV